MGKSGSATQPPSSSAEFLASLPGSKREKLLKNLRVEQQAALLYEWRFWARPKQLPPPGSWRTFVLLGGRGGGKTRAGAEWFRAYAEAHARGLGMIVAMTPGDARDVMIEGPSGLLNICAPWNRPVYEPSKLRLAWPNGFECRIRSAHNPEAIRGPEQEIAWCDEIGAWPDANGSMAWDNLMFGLRIGENPQCVVTTTPRRVPLLRRILASPDTVVTTSSTYENSVNLAEPFLREILARYEGTTLGRQEIHAELLEEIEGALWTQKLIDSTRHHGPLPDLVKVGVGVDPTGGVVETGIVTAALGADGHGYVLEDGSLLGSPDTWGREAVRQYLGWKADRVYGEKNYGGTMVEHVIRTAADAMGVSVSYEDVDATRGKAVRAEPIAALYEQGKIHHVGVFAQLESEMTGWVPGQSGFSPNRLDAMVWVMTKLMLEPRGFGAEAW